MNPAISTASFVELCALMDGQHMRPNITKAINYSLQFSLAASVNAANPIGARGEVPPDDTKSPVNTEHGH